MRLISTVLLGVATLTAGGLGGCSGLSRPAQHTLTSPDGSTALKVTQDGVGRILVRVERAGRVIIDWSPTGLVLQLRPTGGVTALTSFRITGVDRSTARETPDSAGFKKMLVRAEQRPGGRKLDIEARAYDSGVAFRLILPPQKNLPVVRVRSELTTFSFPKDFDCLGVRQTRFANSHEGEYDPLRVSALKATELLDLPVVCRTGNGDETFALTESDLESYSGAYLAARPDRRLGLAIKLAPMPERPGLAVSTPMTAAGVRSPWRAVLISDRPEQMLENRLVQNLAAPSRVPDVSWIRPGKAAWGWWSGQLADGLADPGNNDDTYKHYIDFAQRFGLPYLMIDHGWAHRDRSDSAKAPLADIMRTTDKVNLPELIDYARQRGVRIWLWVNWKALDPKMEEAFTFYEKLGIAGFKVDFLDRQDQEMVAFYHRLLASAARHRLMVNIHGAFVPRGLETTYPNYLTQEGVLALEYNRWSRRVTAGHDVRLAYTRAVIGPMDYTPGGFRNVLPQDFQPRSRAPVVMTTRAHQLALFVVYPSPFSMLADAPSAYEQADGQPVPGADFLKLVPTVWNETRGLGGVFGRYIVVARRSGNRWFLAALNDENGRSISIPTHFLPPGRWRAHQWSDGSAPRAVQIGSIPIGPGKPLIVRLADHGGAVWVIEPDPLSPPLQGGERKVLGSTTQSRNHPSRTSQPV